MAGKLSEPRKKDITMDDECAHCGGSGISPKAQVKELRNRRKALGISVKELASEMGALPNTVSQWEYGIHAASVENIHKYEAGLGRLSVKFGLKV